MPKQPYLEHFKCLECSCSLGPVVEHEGRTAMKFINSDGTNVAAFRAVFECPICGAKRTFYSEPLSGKGGSKMYEQTVFGVCIDALDELVTICELTKAGKKAMEDGGDEEMWKDWTEWFPLEELIERISKIA